MTAQALAGNYPSTSELIIEWDRRRPRSQQRTIGMSDLGGCRRRAGYKLAGTEPSNSGSSIQAALGTMIHAGIAEILEETKAPEDLVEYEVEFAGIVGHLDKYVAELATVVDTKTTSSRWLEHIQNHGPSDAHIWQTSCYGAALIAQGRKVRHIRIDYLARDTGEEYQWTQPFSPAAVKAALAWLAQVRDTDLPMLNRDYAPDSPFCRNCPFFDTCWAGGVPDRDPRSVLYLENPDAKKWAQQLWDARQAKKAAEELEKEAKGALDALRPDDGGALDIGWDHPLRWSLATTERVDVKQVRKEYELAGRKPPVNESQSVTLKFGGAS